MENYLDNTELNEHAKNKFKNCCFPILFIKDKENNTEIMKVKCFVCKQAIEIGNIITNFKELFNTTKFKYKNSCCIFNEISNEQNILASSLIKNLEFIDFESFTCLSSKSEELN